MVVVLRKFVHSSGTVALHQVAAVFPGRSPSSSSSWLSIAVISHLSDHGWARTRPQNAWRDGTEVVFTFFSSVRSSFRTHMLLLVWRQPLVNFHSAQPCSGTMLGSSWPGPCLTHNHHHNHHDHHDHHYHHWQAFPHLVVAWLSARQQMCWQQEEWVRCWLWKGHHCHHHRHHRHHDKKVIICIAFSLLSLSSDCNWLKRSRGGELEEKGRL